MPFGSELLKMCQLQFKYAYLLVPAVTGAACGDNVKKAQYRRIIVEILYFTLTIAAALYFFSDSVLARVEAARG